MDKYYNNYFNNLPNTKVLKEFHKLRLNNAEMKILYNNISYTLYFTFKKRMLKSIFIYLSKNNSRSIEFIYSDNKVIMLRNYPNNGLNYTIYDRNFKVTNYVEMITQFPIELKRLCEHILKIKRNYLLINEK